VRRSLAPLGRSPPRPASSLLDPSASALEAERPLPGRIVPTSSSRRSGGALPQPDEACQDLTLPADEPSQSPALAVYSQESIASLPGFRPANSRLSTTNQRRQSLKLTQLERLLCPIGG
jgi:hypothetical protein